MLRVSGELVNTSWSDPTGTRSHRIRGEHAKEPTITLSTALEADHAKKT